VQGDAIVDVKRHDPIDHQVAHLVGIVNIDDGQEVDAAWVVGGTGELECGRRVPGGDDFPHLVNSLPGPLVQVGNANGRSCLMLPSSCLAQRR
jgi:hypothetical protein